MNRFIRVARCMSRAAPSPKTPFRTTDMVANRRVLRSVNRKMSSASDRSQDKPVTLRYQGRSWPSYMMPKRYMKFSRPTHWPCSPMTASLRLNQIARKKG